MSIKSNYDAVKLIKNTFNISYIKIALSKFNNKTIVISKNNKEISLSLKNIYWLAHLLKNNWEIVESKGNFLTLRNNDIVITCRTQIGWDLGHIKEIYLDNAYDVNVSGKNVIDVGMSNGDSSIYFAKMGAKKVVGIEPDENSFNLALTNMRNSAIENKIITLNKALSVSDNDIEINIYENNPNANSIDIQNMVKLNDHIVKKVVKGINLKSVLNLFNGEKVGLLKMDCEGCEYSILNSLDHEIYNKIDAIYMEYHNKLQNLPEILKRNSFNLEVTNSDGDMGYIKAKKHKKTMST